MKRRYLHGLRYAIQLVGNAEIFLLFFSKIDEVSFRRTYNFILLVSLKFRLDCYNCNKNGL